MFAKYYSHRPSWPTKKIGYQAVNRKASKRRADIKSCLYDKYYTLKMSDRIIQITNIAPAVTKDQLRTLFAFVGKIDEIKLYPENEMSSVVSKVGYVKFDESSSVGVSLHLTNTVFIDRALIVVAVTDGRIPDQFHALKLMAPSNAVAGVQPSQNWPSTVINQVTGTGSNQMITTVDPKLAEMGLPQYPPLPGNVEPQRIEEIRRTIYVGNFDPTVTPEQVLNFFSQAGEIKFVRMAGDDSEAIRSAFIEFTEQRSVSTAFTYNNHMFAGRPLKVSHSMNAIIKPQQKIDSVGAREIEEAMKKVKEAQSLITAAIDPDFEKKGRSSRSRSRSRRRRSRSRRRSTSRSRRRRSRSRSRRRSRSPRRRRSRSRSRKRSRSPRRRKSRSRSRRRKRSRSKSKKKSRSRSRDRKKRSRSRSKRSRSPGDRRRKRSRSGSRRSRSGSKAASPAKPKKEPTPSGDEKSPSRAEPKPRVESKTRSPVRVKREKSPSRRRRSRSRSRKRSASPRRRRSRSPRRRRSRSRGRRSRSGSTSRKSKKEKKRERSRDRKKKRRRSKDEESKKDSKVVRDYDEEEKGFGAEEKEKPASSEEGSPAPPPPPARAERSMSRSESRSPPPPPPPESGDTGGSAAATDANLQQEDMDMDSD